MFEISALTRRSQETLVGNRDTPRKHVRRATTVPLIAAGTGVTATTRSQRLEDGGWALAGALHGRGCRGILCVTRLALRMRPSMWVKGK